MQGRLVTLVRALALVGACGCDRHQQGSAQSLTTEARTGSTPDTWLDVEILDYPSAKPVPGVEVRSSTDFRAWDVEYTDACMEHPDATYRSDERGIVRVAHVGDHFVLAARHGEHWGRANFGRYDSTVRWLTIAPDRSLRVQVVDALGKPVTGIPVALRSIHEGWKHDNIVVRTQGAEGIAVLPHAEYFMWTYEGDPPSAPPRCQFAAALALPLSTPVETVLDGARVPAEVIKLVLPPSGEVEVRCVEADGTPAVLDLPAVLRMPEVAELDAENPLTSQRFGTGTWSAVNGWVARAQTYGIAGTTTAPAEQGRALFKGVELGQRFEAGTRRNYASADCRLSFDGPTRDGQRVVVELRIGAGKAVYSGRLLRADGTPLSNSELTLEELDHPPAAGWELSPFNCVLEPHSVAVGGPMDLRTDSQGRFRFDLEPLSAPHDRIELALTAERLSARAVGVLVSPADCTPGAHDLGDVTVVPAPMLVAGTVRDDSGRAIPGAELSINSVKQEFWLWPHAPVERSGWDGSFEIRSFNQFPSRFVNLEVRARGHVSRQTPIAAPDRARVEFALGRTGRIHGRLLVPEGAARSRYSVSGSSSGFIEGKTQQGADGEFTIDDLPPGRVHVTACAFVQAGPSIELGAWDAEVRVGETTELAPIDLRAKELPKK